VKKGMTGERLLFSGRNRVAIQSCAQCSGNKVHNNVVYKVLNVQLN